MGNTADKLQQLIQTKIDIKDAIEGKGVNVGAVPFSVYPEKINEISIPDPDYQEKSLTINENGITDVLPDEDFDALSKVSIEVNIPIPIPQLQNKSVNIIENGYLRINADSEYDGLNEVEINTNIPAPTPSYQGKTVSIVENGTVDIVADSGYDALSNVRIQTNIPEPTYQEKTIDIIENGISSITPDAGYGGLSKVNINVDVPQGGGPDRSLPVLFFDYDGTLLHSYTIAEAQALTSLPELPTHDLLTSDGWTHTLAQVNGVVGALHVGAQYRTTDGKTHAWVTLTPVSGLALPICFTVTGTATIRVDWGDGQTQNATATSTLTHNYATYGDYEITLERVSGTGTYGLGGGTASTIFIGATSVNYQQTLTKLYAGNNAAIAAYAFYNTSLRSVVISRGITSIGDSAVRGCRMLKALIIPNGIISLTIYAFHSNFSLALVVMPPSITSMDDYVFYSCSSLTSIVIPEGIVSIGNYCFQNCSSLTSIVIPESIANIGGNAFHTCTSLVEYIFRRGVPPTLGNITVFTGIVSICKIYVPDASVSAFKTATNWTTWGNYIYPISSRL